MPASKPEATGGATDVNRGGDTDSRILFIAQQGAARDRYRREIGRTGTSIDTAASIEELQGALTQSAYNGIVIDIPTKIQAMNANLINPFIKAVSGVFATMIEQPVRLGQPVRKKDPVASHPISSVITMQGPVSGCVVVSFAEPVARALASALLDETMATLDADGIDALGEIANMIAGNAKNEFPDDTGTMSVPEVVTGKTGIAYPPNVPIISIPCETESGALIIDVARCAWPDAKTVSPGLRHAFPPGISAALSAASFWPSA
ncbi:MAG: chemotaxis protein CheX [Desulfobacterales bacterium]|jgi:chemotaxis protein CheX